MSHSPTIFSMTGFASRSFSFQGQQFRIELKSLNHRFLEIKFRMSREWSGLDTLLRSLMEKKIKRGSVEFLLEKQATVTATSESYINAAQATLAYETLSALGKKFKLEGGITLRDIVSFPDVISKNTSGMSETQGAEFIATVEAETNLAVDDLLKMRRVEGEKLSHALLKIIDQFKAAQKRLQEQREVIQGRVKEKIRKKIEQCFEAYPLHALPLETQVRTLIETRIAQEMALSFEKTDIEEELTRYQGHLEQLESLLKTGGTVGKKIDFLLQELNREVNTLGNKSQDLDMSQEVIQLKMWVEQLREQCMNLE